MVREIMGLRTLEYKDARMIMDDRERNRKPQ
jgi:hypothetical protein